MHTHSPHIPSHHYRWIYYSTGKLNNMAADTHRKWENHALKIGGMVDWMVAHKKIMSTSYHPEPVNMIWFGKSLCRWNWIKDFKIRSSRMPRWLALITIPSGIIRDTWGKTEERSKVPWRQRLEWCNRLSRNARNHQMLEKARRNSLLKTSEGAWPSKHLDFWY